MSPPHRLRLAFAGSGQQLVASVQLALSRGHEVAGILSDSEEVRQWSARAGLKLTSAADRGTWLDGESVDFLFSIVNHTLLGEKIVRRARRAAINYHDSLLPEYAGFNATAWAILEGRQTHGITWHVMTEEADAGDILLQRTIDIAEDDTAFSLGVKCATAGIETFGELLRLAEGNRLTPTPQAGARTYHRLSERPGVAVLDFSQPTDAVLRLVRSMNFGPEDRAMPRPKLLIGDDVLVVGDARRADGVGKPGTIISVSGTTIDVATADGAVQLYELSTIEGDSKDVSAVLSRAHLVTGDRLPVLLPAMAQELAELDQGIASSESWWVRRLAAATPGRLPIESNNAWAAGAVDLPQALRGRTADERDIIVKSAVAAFVRRLGAESGFDLWIAADIPDHARPFFADVVPLHCEVDVAGTFAALQSQVANETRRLKERRTYARDLPTRYASLRGHTAAPAIIFASPALAGRARDGAQAIIEIGETVRWHLRGASQTDAAELLARFSILLDEACAAPATPIAALPVLTPADRERVLTKWQQTGRDYDRTSTIIREFESQVDRTPDAVAVVFGTSELTYAALNARVNRLAHQLRGEGIGPNVLVGICVRRSTDMLVAMLAVLKAGGAYVPMDPSYPADRLKAMIDDSRASVVLTQQRIASKVPASAARVLDLDAADAWSTDESNPPAAARSGDLAYVLFTSGSTGRPKGVMLEHGNVVNFFAAMDEVLGPGKGVWLAVTSISFDISVLELLWTVSRGFKVIIAPESDRASLERPAETTRRVDFGLFYFAADSGATRTGNAYRLLTEGARYADENGFTAVWTPERHFHAFGGLYPNPAVTTAALATITRRVHLRAGSVVLPLHNPLRVAEDWAVIDQLSGGRIGLSFASGWHVNDFAFMPQNFERRREIMLEHIETILKLWRGEKVSVVNGAGQPIEVAVLPRPIQQRPPLWIASAGTADTFIMAGRLGANILTNMLGQDLADLKNKFAAYREARREAGHSGEGIISVMLHTFVTATDDEAKRLARKPFSAYLASSFDLVKVAPKMFPAFRQPSRGDHGVDTSAFTPEDMEALLDHAFDRYFETAGLFGTPERAVAMVDRLAEIGATEVACLIDFGIDPDVVLSNLPHLRRLQEMSRQRVVRRIDAEIEDVPQLMRRHGVTHLQCTPSLARALIADASGRPFLGQLKEMLVGGEALPPDLAAELTREVTGVVRNMYGPTETTVWSTTSRVQSGTPVTIGRAIANTTIRIVDSTGELTPPGVAGEILIGGDGVGRGYFGRDDLTAERFIPDRWGKGRLYRTGDLGRYATSGEVEFLGRLDHQVKVNGYRIELGEIEAVLNTYPGIKQGVVVAKDAANGTGSELVGYVVRGDQPVLGGNHDRRVAEWRDIWEHTYRATDDGTADPRFRVGGWTNSYNGAPVVASEMREWIDATVERVHALGPKRILEIGCGTGMILYRMLPDVEHYTALDVSPAALDGIRAELTPAERERVTLIEASAHQLETIAGGSVDLVVINSVAQYFPDAEYLRSVLVKASELVRDGGHVFVGDVRSLAHLEAFHTAVAIHQAAPTATVADIRNRVDASVARESELLIADGFFDWVARNTPRYSGARVLLKTSRARNEMSAFRYDVVLDVASEDQAAAVPAAMPANSIDDVRRLVATGAPLIHLSDLQNARLSGIAEASRRLQAHASSTTGDLFPALGMSAGIDPADIAAIAPDYEVEMRWAASGDPWRFDALLRRRSVALRGRWPRPERVQAPSPTPMTNTPAHASQEQALVDVLQNHLRLALPEYMIPQTFVVLDALPLTPNRKIDRNALPAPRRAMTVGRIGYMAPASNLEEQIAGVWSDLLGVERVGRQDNIFDLGANSLLTMQANSRLTELLGRKVSLVSMFRFPTVESLAAHLSPAADGAADDHRVRERAQRAESAAERRRALRKER